MVEQTGEEKVQLPEGKQDPYDQWWLPCFPEFGEAEIKTTSSLEFVQKVLVTWQQYSYI